SQSDDQQDRANDEAPAEPPAPHALIVNVKLQLVVLISISGGITRLPGRRTRTAAARPDPWRQGSFDTSPATRGLLGRQRCHAVSHEIDTIPAPPARYVV